MKEMSKKPAAEGQDVVFGGGRFRVYGVVSLRLQPVSIKMFVCFRVEIALSLCLRFFTPSGSSVRALWSCPRPSNTKPRHQALGYGSVNND